MLKVFLITLVVFIGSLNAVKSHAKQNFGCNAILNEQIKKEFDASHTYLSMANHFAHDSQALHGFSKMFYSSWKEELSHGEHLMDYVIKRGGTPCTPKVDIPSYESNWGSKNACEVLHLALKLEKSVTDHLLSVHSCARGEKNSKLDAEYCNSKTDCPCPTEREATKEDPHLQDFLEGEFLTEQVDGIKELADLITRLERVGCNGLGLHMINDELYSKFNK